MPLDRNVQFLPREHPIPPILHRKRNTTALVSPMMPRHIVDTAQDRTKPEPTRENEGEKGKRVAHQ
jgi:hypothetical protein